MLELRVCVICVFHVHFFGFPILFFLLKVNYLKDIIRFYNIKDFIKFLLFVYQSFSIITMLYLVGSTFGTPVTVFVFKSFQIVVLIVNHYCNALYLLVEKNALIKPKLQKVRNAGTLLDYQTISGMKLSIVCKNAHGQ